MKGFIVYATYDNVNNETVVQLFGRLENGQSFLTVNKLEPYFFVKKKDSSHLPKTQKFEEVKMKNFAGEEVVKVSFNNQTLLNEAYKKLHKKIEVYEGDIKPHYRFIMDKNLLGCVEINGNAEPTQKIDKIYIEPKLTSASFKPELKIISIDTESDKKTGKLFCIGMYGKNYKKNFMITSHELKNTISCKTETECLEKFKVELIKLDPDVITGWNVIDFDFVYLKNLFRENKISFDIGRTDDEVSLRIEKSFFRSSKMDIPGRQVLDGINLIRDPFLKEAPSIKHAKFESFSLEDISQEILKDGKLIAGKNRHEEIEKLYKEQSEKSLQNLVDYNLQDCKLVFDILEKIQMIDLALERSKLTGMPLDRLTASIAAFDSLYIREARARGIVSPSQNFREKEARIKGGYVQSLKSGIYRNVLVLDFKSLYPSIIRTFNIDPASYINKAKGKNIVEAPNGALFINREGILPSIIEKLHHEREKAKKEKREFSNHAIKTIMNSFFGVLANPNCRYFDLKIANAITSFGQFLIKLTASEIEKIGYKVIYSDTDSVFVETNLSKEKANALGEKIEKQINDFYKKYLQEKYSRESFLELQFDKQYLALMIPQIRGKENEETAAKKRYAGLIEKDGKEKIEIVGLEAIRGDWTEAAQEFQVELLKKAFKNEPIEKFIRDYIEKIKQGKMDDKLVYRKSIRKELAEYTKTTPPHVKAARQLDNLESNVIEYYMTTAGPEPIQKLKHKIDYEHYIKKQIEPIANQILVLTGKKFEDVAENSKQAKLF